MNKLKNVFTIILLFILIFILFKYTHIISISVLDSVNIWLNKVFPSLFLIFILNDIIIEKNYLVKLTNLFGPIFNKIFHTTSSSSLAFALSLFSGTPSSAFILTEMIHKSITLDDANKLIRFTFFVNPLFLYNILKLSFNNYITIKIISVTYLSNIIIGLLFRGNLPSTFVTARYKNTETSIFYLLSKSIKKSLDTLLMILGTITFYMIISNIIINIFDLPYFLQIIIKGILEITQSLNILDKLHCVSIIKEIMAICIISFGGLSIHSQILSLINSTGISYKNFLISRILHVLISSSIYLIIYLL